MRELGDFSWRPFHKAQKRLCPYFWCTREGVHCDHGSLRIPREWMGAANSQSSGREEHLHGHAVSWRVLRSPVVAGIFAIVPKRFGFSGASDRVAAGAGVQAEAADVRVPCLGPAEPLPILGPLLDMRAGL